MVGIPNILATRSFIRLRVQGENHSLDLITLINWPDETQKFLTALKLYINRLGEKEYNNNIGGKRKQNQKTLTT